MNVRVDGIVPGNIVMHTHKVEDIADVETTYLKLDQSTPQTLTTSPIFSNLTAGRVIQVGSTKAIENSTLIKDGAGVLTLSAAADYTLTVPATGTALLASAAITTGYIPFGIAGSLLGSDVGLFWDNTNKRLGVGTTGPTADIHTTGNVRTGNFVLAGKPQAFNNTFSYGGYTPDAFMYLDSTYNTYRIGINPGSTYANISFMLAGQDVMALTATSMSPALAFDNTIALGRSGQRWKSLTVGTDDSSFGGNVGIGTTGPTSKLDISGSATGANTIFNVTNTATNQFLGFFQGLAPNMAAGNSLAATFGKALSNYNRGYFAYNHVSDGSTSNFIDFGFYGAGNLLNIQASGNVGIGTTSPISPLHVVGASGDYGQITLDSAATNQQTNFALSKGGLRYWAVYVPAQNSSLSFYADPARANGVGDVMTLTNTGNVGIGTTAPTRILGIDGLVARNIGMERGTVANTAGFALTVNAGGSTVGATDKAGGQLILVPGISTGSGESGVTIQGCVAGATGTADRSMQDMIKILGNKLGFFNGTPIIQQTLAAYTSDGQGSAYTGIDNAQAGTVYATVADLNQLRVAYETLRASYDDLKTKLQATTLIL
jgi:hypothetical protein